MVAMPSLHRSLAAREPFICRSEFLPYDDTSLTTPPLGVSPALSRARALPYVVGLSHELPLRCLNTEPNVANRAINL